MKKAKAIKYIGQNATGDTPSFTMAEKGQELLLLEEVAKDSWAYNENYRFVCQDIEKRYGSFFVEANEIEIIEND